MTKRPEPRRVEVDGAEMVVLETQTYEQLWAYRRQVGAQGARLRELRRQVQLLNDYLDDVARHVRALPACCTEYPTRPCPHSGEAECPLRALHAVLDRRPAHDVRHPS